MKNRTKVKQTKQIFTSRDKTILDGDESIDETKKNKKEETEKDKNKFNKKGREFQNSERIRSVEKSRADEPISWNQYAYLAWLLLLVIIYTRIISKNGDSFWSWFYFNFKHNPFFCYYGCESPRRYLLLISGFLYFARSVVMSDILFTTNSFSLEEILFACGWKGLIMISFSLLARLEDEIIDQYDYIALAFVTVSTILRILIFMREEWALQIRKRFLWHTIFSLDEFNTFVEMTAISSWLFICKRTVFAFLPFAITAIISIDSYCHKKYDSVHSIFQTKLEQLLQDLKKVKVP